MLILKIINKVFCAIIFFVFLCCQSNDQLPEDRSTIRIALQNRVDKRVHKKHGAYQSGLGFVGPDNYRKLQSHFDFHNLLTKDEARYMIVDIAAIYLEEVNKDGEIRPYLSQFPYCIENLSIAILPTTQNYEKPVHPEYVSISLSNGKITYKTKEEGQRYDYCSIETETFEEALDKLRKLGQVPEYFKDYLKQND